MRRLKTVFGLIISFIFLASFAQAENGSLQYFLAKSASGLNELPKKEKEELLNRINEVMEQAWRIRDKLTQAIQRGDMEVQYQEGRFWISRLEEDRGAIETGLEQLKLLRERPVLLVPSIKLFKSLKDLSKNFNAYNNVPFLCAYVGDLAPELELWADPVFYGLYLLPLAKSKEGPAKPPQKEKKPLPKEKKS
jgi:hypothetical protein